MEGGRGIPEFKRTGANDSAQGEHMEGFFLLISCLSVVSPSRQRHEKISSSAWLLLKKDLLHPENLYEFVIDPPGLLAMSASRKELGIFRGERRAEYYVIGMPTAGCAGFSSDLSANCAYFSGLFLHLLPPSPRLVRPHGVRPARLLVRIM